MKTSDIGIDGDMYRWIKDFLTNLTIQTELNDSISSKGSLGGSCLSCILFLIYTKDLEDVLDIVLALYADDLVLWVTLFDNCRWREQTVQYSEPQRREGSTTARQTCNVVSRERPLHFHIFSLSLPNYELALATLRLISSSMVAELHTTLPR